MEILATCVNPLILSKVGLKNKQIPPNQLIEN